MEGQMRRQGGQGGGGEPWVDVQGQVKRKDIEQHYVDGWEERKIAALLVEQAARGLEPKLESQALSMAASSVLWHVNLKGK